MLKVQRRTTGAIAVLVMLATSSISATYSFGEIGQVDLEEKHGGELRIILTEQIIDGKLEVQRYSLPNNINEDDLQRAVFFDSPTSNWAYVSNAYNSGIVLFDGKASKLGDNVWKISSEIGIIGNLGLTRNSISSEWGSSEAEFSYKIIFSGNNGEFDIKEQILMGLDLEFKNPEIQQTMECTKAVGVKVDSEKVESNIQLKGLI